MKLFWYKLRAIWLLLGSGGFILTYVKNPRDEEIDAGFLFIGLDAEQIALFCDSLADEMDILIQEEDEERMANKIGQGMINFINLN